MTEQPLEKNAVSATGRQMAYHERGTGAPILFLHGNPAHHVSAEGVSN